MSLLYFYLPEVLSYKCKFPKDKIKCESYFSGVIFIDRNTKG